ncbi:MAG: hypothetical protein LBB43_00185, partial [Spirochaetaceae bacterium]|nr:hypothetical protein [Spirochaetaceae bacterium]
LCQGLGQARFRFVFRASSTARSLNSFVKTLLSPMILPSLIIGVPSCPFKRGNSTSSRIDQTSQLEQADLSAPHARFVPIPLLSDEESYSETRRRGLACRHREL